MIREIEEHPSSRQPRAGFPARRPRIVAEKEGIGVVQKTGLTRVTQREAKVMVSSRQAADYLAAYALRYREEYEALLNSHFEGVGRPPYPVSSYLGSPEITCHLCDDGYALADQSDEPGYDWWVAGGPAIMVDYSETRRPESVTAVLRQWGLLGQSIGIYRIVAKRELPQEVWDGTIPDPIEVRESRAGPTTFEVLKHRSTWLELIQRLTFGALGSVLDLKLPDDRTELWSPTTVHRMGFLTADYLHKRFFNYLELSPHVDYSAWDLRSMRARVQLDVRRDYAESVMRAETGSGAFIHFRKAEMPTETWREPLSTMRSRIADLERLLSSSTDESDYQRFLEANPVLLDVYGDVEAKPRFYYPEGASEGKVYVEPDFLVKYPNGTYRLVELERPGSPLLTRSGRPRAEVTQPAFQIAEWRTFIAQYYRELSARYPGISSDCPATIIIGHSSEPNIRTLRQVYRVDEVLTYEDLLLRAKAAFSRISTNH